MGKMDHELKTLRGKVIQAAKRRDETLRRQFIRAQAQTFPQGHPQERTLGVVYFLNLYGPALIDRLMEELPIDLGRHWVSRSIYPSPTSNSKFQISCSPSAERGDYRREKPARYAFHPDFSSSSPWELEVRGWEFLEALTAAVKDASAVAASPPHLKATAGPRRARVSIARSLSKSQPALARLASFAPR